MRTTHYAQFVASRKKMNVHERTFLQHTPMGDMVIVTLQSDDPESAFKNFGAAKDAFTDFFAAGVKNAHGIDVRQPPPSGSMPELILDSMS